MRGEKLHCINNMLAFIDAKMRITRLLKNGLDPSSNGKPFKNRRFISLGV
jgi:hypothetical protein